MQERTLTTEIGRDVSKARALLERGLAVAIPTETVYGLAANALDARAVADIFAIKDRPFFDPLIVHSDSRDRLLGYVLDFPEWALKLSDRFWPGPLTLILPKRESIPDIVTSGQPTVAIRVPAHPLALELLSQLDFPLAAPSANPFGYVSPTTPKHVSDQLSGKLSYILDGGECSIGVESTIVSDISGEITILRLGGLSVEEIEALVGPVRVQVSSSNAVSPGSLEHHYAPRTPIVLGPIDPAGHRLDDIAILSFSTRYPDVAVDRQIVLSPEGDLREAAQYLFAALRNLDKLNVKVILADVFPEVGLGRAINDRLRRASAKRE